MGPVNLISCLSWRLFFFLLLSFSTNASKRCPAASCGNDSMPFRFPFRLEGQQSPSCGYPGFNITCSRGNTPILKLPYSGEFVIRYISYGLQLIVLNDPGGCLPKRLQGLDLSGSPFKALSYRDYIFLSCPSQLQESQLNGINCLGNSTHSTLVTSSMKVANSMSHVCKILYTRKIPVAGTVDFDEGEFTKELNKDLPLKWEEPNCGDCVERGGTCGYINEGSREIRCFYDDQRGRRY